MARYESLNGNHDDDEVQDQHRHVVHDEEEEAEDQRRHTGSSGSSKSSYTVVGQCDEKSNAGSRAVYAALYGAGAGSVPSGGLVHSNSDDQQNSDHHHQQTIHPVLQNPGAFVDAPLIPPKSPARSTSNNPFFNATTSSTSTAVATTTSSPQQQQQAQGSTRSSRPRFRSGSGSGSESSKYGGDQHAPQQSQSRTTKSRSTSRDSSNYVNQYSRSWKPQFGVPQLRAQSHAFPPLPETEEAHTRRGHHHDHGHDSDHHDHGDSSGDDHDLDHDDYMYEKETGGGISTPRAGRSRTGTVTGSVRGKNGGGVKGGMRKLMLVERTDTKRSTTRERGRKGTMMSEVSIDAADSISVKGLPIHPSGAGGGSGFGQGGLTTTIITAGGSNGVNRSEQHLSYFHFESTDTLVQSKQSMLGWWLEGLGVLGGLVCVVVIGLVLSMYDRKPPPSTWPSPLNLNVFLSFMTTLATAWYMIPVVEGLGQLRWLRYTGGRHTVSRPASDFQAIDQASRGGIHHSWKLLGFQGGPLGLLASLIIILTLFTPCLTQLVITYSPPQPHHNNFGEPFDSHASPVSLVMINWPWLWFLLCQILLSAIFLTAVIVQTRMEGIQIFKTSALPGMMALDGQARVSLGGVMGNVNSGIMTNAAMKERAKKTILRMERAGGGNAGNHGLVQGFVVDLAAPGSNSKTTGSPKSAGRKGLGLGFERFRHHHDHHSASHSPAPSYDKEFGEGHFDNSNLNPNLNYPAAAAAAAGFTPLAPSGLTPMPIATTVPASAHTAKQSGRKKMLRMSLFGGGLGGGTGKEKMRVGGLPVHAS